MSTSALQGIPSALDSRVPLSTLEMDGVPYDLTRIGAGNSALVYRAVPRTRERSARIVKVYTPLHVPATEAGRDAYNRAANTISADLNVQFHTEESNQFEHHDIRVATIDGRGTPVLTCPDFNGVTFREYLHRQAASEHTAYVRAILHLAYVMFFDITVFHHAGYVNLDIKSDNLYMIYINDAVTPHCVRSIDLGSARKLDDAFFDTLTAALEEAEDKMYIADPVRHVAEQFFASSAPFYVHAQREQFVADYLDGEMTPEVARRRLFRLDLIAGWKTLLYALAYHHAYGECAAIEDPASRDREASARLLAHMMPSAGARANSAADSADDERALCLALLDRAFTGAWTEDKPPRKSFDGSGHSTYDRCLLADYFLYHRLRAITDALFDPEDTSLTADTLRKQIGDLYRVIAPHHAPLAAAVADADTQTLTALHRVCQTREADLRDHVSWIRHIVNPATAPTEGDSDLTFPELLAFLSSAFVRQVAEERHLPLPLTPGHLLKEFLLMNPEGDTARSTAPNPST